MWEFYNAEETPRAQKQMREMGLWNLLVIQVKKTQNDCEFDICKNITIFFFFSCKIKQWIDTT